jgi:hypothetical protein
MRFKSHSNAWFEKEAISSPFRVSRNDTYLIQIKNSNRAVDARPAAATSQIHYKVSRRVVRPDLLHMPIDPRGLFPEQTPKCRYTEDFQSGTVVIAV